MTWIVAYIAAAITFVVLDMLWLGWIASGFYKAEMGPLLADPVNVPAAVVFYALYLVGVLIFAVRPGLDAGSIGHGALMGALFGFFAYAAYDLTSLAVIKGYTLKLAVVDMAWGTFLTGAVAAVATAIALRWS
jgi:uncharacterized membrane protein